MPPPHNLARLPGPAKFSGKPQDNFDEWEKKFRNYMGLSDHKFDTEMRWATNETAEITDDRLATNDDELSEGECKQRSLTLYYTLSHFLEGNAFIIMDQLEDLNGYEAWRRLSQRFLKSSTQSALTTLISIVNTKFPDDNNFEAVLSKWEKEITQFEKSVKKLLYDEIKTGLLIAGATGNCMITYALLPLTSRTTTASEKPS